VACFELCALWNRQAGFRFANLGKFPVRKPRKVMQQRLRPKPHTFEDQIAAEKSRCNEQLANIPHGPERDALAKKIRQLDTASHMNDWLRSPGLKSPE
jgi:hypothetical protein